MTLLGTALRPAATRVMLLGSGELGKEVAIECQRLGIETIAVDRYPDAPAVPFTVLINPTITPVGDAMHSDWEGCLSVPGLRGKVPRFAHIRYTGWDPYGDPIDRTVEGFHARVVQHECDHLIGKLYPMRLRDFSQFGFTEVLFPGLDATDD